MTLDPSGMLQTSVPSAETQGSAAVDTLIDPRIRTRRRFAGARSRALRTGWAQRQPSIAILGTRGIPARYGGFETFAEELAKGLVKRGVAVTVFCEGPPPAVALRSVGGVALEYVPAPSLGPLTTILFDLRCILRAGRRFDVIYICGYGASPFFWLSRLLGVRLWVNMDGVEWRRPKWNLLGRLYLRFAERMAMLTASRIIADAAAIRDHLLRRTPRTRGVTVIPYGARVIEEPPPVNALTKRQLKADGYYILVARIEPENHVIESIRGFLASASDAVLAVVGDLKPGCSYSEAVRSLEGPRVRLLGGVYDSAELIALRYHARGCLHGHSVGGTNPSLLEALGCGNPVIAHDNPFNREVLGTDAWYFRNHGDIPAAISEIDRMNAARRAEIAARMRARIVERYLWKRIVGMYHALILEEARETRSVTA